MKANQLANPQLLNQPKSFRQDINGLRAWAVVAVVFYHFGVPFFAGGFVGVDVFFVISGFLMTGIIITDIERENFSLSGFYLARARRIIPALLVLCASLLVFGWFWLSSADYKLLASHVGSAIVFVSNFKFWREASYFDVTSHEKWLLHTWSLSVEWQFYVLLPLGCLLLWRSFGSRGIKLAMIVTGLLSLVLSTYASVRWPSLAFYLLPTRAWEMLAGGLVWWGTRRQPIPRYWAALTEKIGFVLIIIAITTFNPEMHWPGYLALVPVVGAMLILAANRQNSWLTGNLMARHLGASSYSIYLWHWPLVVFLTYAGETTNTYLIIAGIGLSLVFGNLSYNFIENTTRIKLSSKFKSKELSIILSSVSMIFAAIFFINIFNLYNSEIRTGASSASSKYLDKYSREKYLTEFVKKEYKEECNFFDENYSTAKSNGISPSCTQKKYNDGIFLWGDSHAQALSFGIRSNLKEKIDFYQIATAGCQPHIDTDNTMSGEFKVACDRSNKAAINEIKRLNPNVVIMAQRYNHDKNHYDLIVDKLFKIGIKNIVIIGPVPQWQPSLPRAIALRHFDKKEKYLSDSSFDKKVLEIDKFMKNKYRNDDRVTYISLIQYLQKEDGTLLAKVDNENTPLVWDYGHLSLAGSEFIASHVLSENNKLRFFLKN